MRQKRALCLAAALALTAGCVVPAHATRGETAFSDVDPEAWYAQAVTYCTENGLMNGVGDGVFSPDTGISRSMLATVLHRMAGSPTGQYAHSFSDVPEGTWYTDAAKWAASTGVITGNENGEFVPEMSVTQEQLATVLYRFAQNEGRKTDTDGDHTALNYADISTVSTWAYQPMEWAVRTGILFGLENNGSIFLYPQNVSTRAQLAYAFMNYVTLEKEEGKILQGTQTAVIEGFDWGPAVTKTILTLDQSVVPASVTADSFAVTERKESFDFASQSPEHIVTEATRTVTNAYVCDAQGTPVETASRYIALELNYSPSAGSPYCYDMLTGKNTVCNPYELSISLSDTANLVAEDGSAIPRLNIEKALDLSHALTPQLEGVDFSGAFTGTDGKRLTYGSYEPPADGQKHPLVIWIHGAGEGGTDASIPVLGNKVSALYGKEFQSIMGGAYILTPQTPTFWLQYDEEGNWQDNPGTDSIYLSTFMELVESYVAEHDAIDRNRIYIGGCSNGGFMAVDVILNHPDYFAAAFPICEAYLAEGITDAQLERMKDLPTWFVYAENDTVVPPESYEIPLVERLKEIGANVHTSVFPNVADTTGLYQGEDGGAYQYMGHWSWIYFFNNQCEENGVSLWNWLAEQSK